MEIVYPVTALYWGPVALWFYLRHGRASVKDAQRDRGGGETDAPIPWPTAAEAVSHCGAGCTIADIVGEWTVFALGLSLAGSALFADYLFDLVLAWALGIVFQYFTIVPMRHLSFGRGVWAAIRADTLSILAFQVGLFAGMWFSGSALFAQPISKATATYWFFMQLSMILGFFTAYPVNVWLIEIGWKERM